MRIKALKINFKNYSTYIISANIKNVFPLQNVFFQNKVLAQISVLKQTFLPFNKKHFSKTIYVFHSIKMCFFKMLSLKMCSTINKMCSSLHQKVFLQNIVSENVFHHQQNAFLQNIFPQNVFLPSTKCVAHSIKMCSFKMFSLKMCSSHQQNVFLTPSKCVLHSIKMCSFKVYFLKMCSSLYQNVFLQNIFSQNVFLPSTKCVPHSNKMCSFKMFVLKMCSSHQQNVFLTPSKFVPSKIFHSKRVPPINKRVPHSIKMCSFKDFSLETCSSPIDKMRSFLRQNRFPQNEF